MIDVLLSALLIGPASVLMGGTIPILTQALARSLDDATRFHAFVYAFNTVGAFVGALAAGFYLVPRLGLVNVMLTTGTINLFAGSVFLILGRRGRAVVSLAQEPAQTRPSEVSGFGLYAAVALLTGFAMMAIQTIVIRIAGLSFGSSQFTFSMVVAVFVLCIALGSFCVSAFSRIPRVLVVVNQWLLAVLLLALYPQLEASPYWVHVLRTLFRDETAAFPVYYLLGFLLVVAAVGLPVLLSGAALPLLFHHLRREVGHLGDLAGKLYSWNTVGSLLGALLGGYLLLIWLDLHHVYRVAVASLGVAAALLTDRIYGRRALALALGAALLAIVALLPQWQPQLLYAGLFRVREPLAGTYAGPSAFKELNPGRFAVPILLQADDPIASVTVTEYPTPGGARSLSIATNGKSDGNTFVDYTTMALAGTLPAMLAEKPEHAFVIGWGTGITAAELASLESMREVQVVEISQAVLDAAPLFDFANQQASSNPKIRVIRSDAYRALMRMNRSYDVIVSEPSNPWMTGVEMLFSREFLTAARARLTPGGVYGQWIHQYETSNETLELVLRTYASVFDEIAVWGTVYNDLLLLGFNGERSAVDYYRLAERAERADYKASLQRAGIVGLSSLLAHEILPVGVVHALDLAGPIHTLYHPRLNDVAARAFFRGDRGELPFAGYGEPARIGREKSLLSSHVLLHGGHLPEVERSAYVREACRSIGPRCQSPLAQWRSEGADSPLFRATAEWVRATLASYSKTFEMIVADADHLDEMAALFGGGSRPGSASSELQTPDSAEQITQDFLQLYHLPTPFSAERLLALWESCREGRTTLEQCRENAEKKRAISDDVDVDSLVEQCLSVKMVGPQCQAGLAAARELTEHGLGARAAIPSRPHGRSHSTDFGR